MPTEPEPKPTDISEYVTVNKAQLIAAIRDNREQHRQQFELALEGWHADALERLNKLKQELSKGKRFNVAINLLMPEDHTPDYDLVLKMLTMHLADTVTIPTQEFRQYVMDDWSWKRQWTNSNSAYVAAGAKLSQSRG